MSTAPQIHEIAPTDVASISKAWLIDVREAFEFRQIHAEGVDHIALGQLNPQQVAEQAEDRPLVILCHAGGRAMQAAKQIITHAQQDIYVVQGGTQAWHAAGLPVHQAAKAGISVDRQMRMVAGGLALSGVLLDHFVQPGFMWLSAFIGAGLFFAGASGICPYDWLFK